MDVEKELNKSEDFFRVFDHTPKIDNFTGKKVNLDKISGAIEFKNVSFAYPKKP